MKTIIFAAVQAVSTWWNNLSDELAFAIWFAIWYIPVFIATIENTTGSWIVAVVAMTICGVWFVADTAISHYKKQLEDARRSFDKAAKKAMEEAKHYRCDKED